VVVDDHQLFADALRMFLDRDDRIEVVGTADNGADAIDLAVSALADVVLMDVFMRGMDGLEAAQRLRAIRPEAHVIMVSGLSSEEIEIAARDAGADAHMQKGAIHEHIIERVLEVADRTRPL
jgi:two-component system, NarL family, response regulator LiaR